MIKRFEKFRFFKLMSQYIDLNTDLTCWPCGHGYRFD